MLNFGRVYWLFDDGVKQIGSTKNPSQNWVVFHPPTKTQTNQSFFGEEKLMEMYGDKNLPT